MNVIDTARDALIAELEPLEKAYIETKERLDLINQSKQQIEAALKALAPTKPKPSRKSAKRCARQSDVHSVCLALVEANPSIPKDDLEALARQKLSSEMGFSLSGFGLRFSEIMESSSFVVTQSGSVTLLARDTGTGASSHNAKA